MGIFDDLFKPENMPLFGSIIRAPSDYQKFSIASAEGPRPEQFANWDSSRDMPIPGATFPGTVLGDPAGSDIAKSYQAANPPIVAPDHLDPSKTVSRFTVGGRGGPEGSRLGGSGGPPGRTYDMNADILAQYEQQRAALLERRNMAISAAGRGAGAPYNAAIARLNDEIEKAKGQLGRVGPLFDQKSANQRVAWDNADAELQVSADEALSKMDQLNTQTYNALSQTWSDAQSSTAGVLDKIGADDATRAAAAEEVGRLEDEIYEMNEVDAVGRSRILQASEDLAVAMAKSAGADNQLELVRNKIMVESDLKEKINNMLEDRKQQTRARNAAVAAARDMAAARFPSDIPMNREGWASVAANEAINKVMGGKPQRDKDMMHEMLGQFTYAGVSTKDARKIFRERNWEDPSEATLGVLNKYGFSPETFAGIPQSTYRSLGGNIVTAMNTYDHSLRYYDDTIANADPDTFAPGTSSHALALGEQLRKTGMSEEDVRHTAIDVANDAERGKDTSKFNEIIGWN